MNRLRVVLVVGTLLLGGTETQLAKLACGLRARGHDVSVVALSRGGPLEPVLRRAGVDVAVFGFRGLWPRDAGGRRSLRSLPGGLRTLYALWRYLRARRPDVCHAFLFTSYTHALPLAWAAGVPVRVNGRRGASPDLRRPVYRFLNAIGHRASSVYVCNSRSGAQAVQSTENVARRRIRVIVNGVEPPDRPADPGRQPARGVVVANLIPYKGHEDLLAALASLPDPPRVCLVGDGPHRSRIERLVAEYGLTGAVELTGTVDDARDVLPAYQFAVLPSHQEGLPNAVLEAMAAGLPVVATAVGGTPELVTDGVTGLLVPPRSPDRLAAAIARLAGDPALRVRLGAAAREAAEGFSMASCLARHEVVYRERLP